MSRNAAKPQLPQINNPPGPLKLSFGTRLDSIEEFDRVSYGFTIHFGDDLVSWRLV